MTTLPEISVIVFENLIEIVVGLASTEFFLEDDLVLSSWDGIESVACGSDE